jgi:hypothetical protein
MEQLIVDIITNTDNNNNNINKTESKMLNANKSLSSHIITNTSSSSNSLTFTDDDDLSSSSSGLTKTNTTITNINSNPRIMLKQEEKNFSILKVVPTDSLITPMRSTAQNSSSSSSSSCCSSSGGAGASSDSQEKQHQNQEKKFIFILNAFVNGFAQLKLCENKIDYEYIIEIYWSNEDRSFVKRTYDDFVLFHRNLIQKFSQFFNEINQTNQNFKNSNRNSRLFYNNFDDYIMPVLPSKTYTFNFIWLNII